MTYKVIINYYGNSRNGFHARGYVTKSEYKRFYFSRSDSFASAMSFEDSLDKAIENCLSKLKEDLEFTNRYTLYPAELPSIRFPDEKIIKKGYKRDIDSGRLIDN